MKIVAIIPARYQSTRLPAKVIADICGKTMIERVYLQVKKSKLVNDIFVATDDDRVTNVVKSFGGKHISTPHESITGSDRVAYAAKNVDADLIVNVQGDEPLISPILIDQVIQLFIDDEKTEVGTAAKIITDENELFNKSVVKLIIDKFNNAIYFSRAAIPYLRDVESDWVKKHDYLKHFGIYVYKKSALMKFTEYGESLLEKEEKLEQLRFLSNNIEIKVAFTKEDSIAVDTQDDLDRVRNFISQNKQF